MAMRIMLTLLLSIIVYTASAQVTYSITRDTFVKLEAKTFFDTAQVKPKFKGNLGEYLSGHIRMPKGAKPQGKIMTQFWIDTMGRISHIKILDKDERAPITPLEKEIVRVIKGMPSWLPGMYKGKKVAVKYSLPFILN